MISKRLIFSIIGLIVWVVLILTTQFEPVEVATGLMMIIGSYIVGETFRGSSKNEKG